MNSHLIQYVLWGAIRDRLILSMLVLMGLGASLSIFLGSAAVIEKDQFTVVFASGGLRIASVVGLILFTVFFIRKSFETKDIEFLLSRPTGRISLIASYSIALILIALVLSFVTGGVVYALAPHLLSQGHILWTLSICIENIIMVNVALFFSMVITSSAGAAMATFGFYILCRMMGQILGIASVTAQNPNKMSEIMEYIVETVSIFLPRLDLLGQTSWLIYGPGPNIGAGFILLQGLVFTTLIVCACMYDLVRRQF